MPDVLGKRCDDDANEVDGSGTNAVLEARRRRHGKQTLSDDFWPIIDNGFLQVSSLSTPFLLGLARASALSFSLVPDRGSATRSGPSLFDGLSHLSRLRRDHDGMLKQLFLY